MKNYFYLETTRLCHRRVNAGSESLALSKYTKRHYELDGLNLRYSDISNVIFPSISHVDFCKNVFTNCDLHLVSGQFNECVYIDCKINWNSHEMLADILYQRAHTTAQKMVAGFILINQTDCWKEFLRHRHPERRWALTTLAKYIQPDDNHPKILDKYRKGKSNVTTK